MPWKNPEVRRQKKREWYARTAEARQQYFREYNRMYNKENRDELRLKHVKRYYNLNAEEYLQMILDQNNCCAICHKPETHKNRNGDVRPLSVDHMKLEKYELFFVQNAMLFWGMPLMIQTFSRMPSRI